MFRKIIVFILLYITIIIQLFSQIGFDKDKYYTLLKTGKFKTAYEELIEIQKKPYGKTSLTDFLIGKALCLSGKKESAKKRFENIIINYRQLSPATKDLVRKEMNNCSPYMSNESWTVYNVIPVFLMPTAGVSGKLGKVYDCYQEHIKVEISDTISEDEFQTRIFNTSSIDTAIKKIKTLIPRKYTATAKGNFILVTHIQSKITNSKRDSIFFELEKTLKFYTNYYRLTPTDKVITAYLLPDIKFLQEIALIVHGFKIPRENYGYSLIQDYSILSMNNFLGTGTLKHELFHIVVRSDVGDIPVWLDEGISSLYEESHWENDKLIPDNKFWRTSVLKDVVQSFQLYAMLPDLGKLVSGSWDDFDGHTDDNICMAASNYALAKHFVAYLDNKNKLVQVLDEYRNRRNDDTINPMLNNLELLERAMNMKIAAIEVDFDNWFESKYSFSILSPYPETYDYDHNRLSINSVSLYKNNIIKLRAITDSLIKNGSIDDAMNVYSYLNASINTYNQKLRYFQNSMQLLFQSNIKSDKEYESFNLRHNFMKAIDEINKKLGEIIKKY